MRSLTTFLLFSRVASGLFLFSRRAMFKTHVMVAWQLLPSIVVKKMVTYVQVTVTSLWHTTKDTPWLSKSELFPLLEQLPPVTVTDYA